MAKKYYFSVENPNGLKRTIFAETNFEAVAKAVEMDGYKWANSNYKYKKL